MQLRTTLCFFVLASAGFAASAQNAPQSPVPQAPAPQAATPQAPNSPAAAQPAAPANPFPPVDPANFTATTPTKQTVEDFLNAFWGYDSSRLWQVQAILPTQASGVSRVLVLVKAANPQPKEKDQIAQLSFYTLPDGKWLVADQLLPFGSKPFENFREILKANASGPSKGGASKDMEIVEFSDFECPHCKDAQPVIQKLLADYPSAHFVHQDFPLVQIHPEALKAALHGYCVSKAGGNEAFFKFSDAVFEAQSGLTPATADETLKDAETKAGQDPAKIAACSITPEAKAAVDASRALGERVGVNQTPTLYVNGRALPVNGIPYEMLQKIVEFQAKLDGVPLPPAPPAPPARPAPSLR
ncbi:MAG: thioredoxin domain-containing protein [Acidobacteriaceae bacterium]